MAEETKKKRGRPRKNPDAEQPKKKVGRPPIEITPELLKKAEQLAAQGLTKYQIASVLGMGKSTLTEKQSKYPAFLAAINNGQAKGIAQITNKLFQKASEGDNTAMIFYLKNRDPDNWEDVQKRRISGDDGGPIKTELNVNFSPVKRD